MRGERGFALILTLVVTALMVAVLVELIHGVYVDISLSRGYRDGQQASLLAESGVTGGIKLLQLSIPPGTNGTTSLSDAWATPVKLDDETGALEVTVSEESGKINLNNLAYSNGVIEPYTQAALKRLGKRLQIPDEIWNSLADWQDSNDETRSNGAETPYYRSLKRPYAARNGKLVTLTELSLVKGFTPEIIDKLKPFVTIYADQSTTLDTVTKVNINTAPKEVLMALDDAIDERMAERILEERRLKPFEPIGDLARIPGGATISLSPSFGGLASVKGKLFRITSVARVKETARKVEAVIRLSGNGVDTLYWQE
ncbi:MAG: type II secretion system minor pseudopilin GspK [Desulfuromonadales bacterium]|nr:type II secretion system minor pseudopilin GspK [Desulfuromonadales bacterium]